MPKSAKRSASGAEIVIDALEQEGVEVVFGYPGGAILDVFDHVNRSKKFKFFLTRHEQGAGHMADGYARATGKCGVMIVTSGPGATNTVTALATAHMDSVPIVCISGQVPTAAIGNDAFQEADVVGITRPVTKHNYLVKDINELPRVLKEAFFIATSGRPGPVVIDIPKDVQKAVLEDYSYPKNIEMRSYKPVRRGNSAQVKRAARAIEQAERPLLYVGQGAVCSDAQAELIELSERCNIPVTTTLLGLGAFPEKHPNAMHMLGMHGTAYANYVMHETDLIIAVGARFDDRVTGKLEEFAPRRKGVIHIDIDPSEISKTIAVTIPVVGDCKLILRDLLKEVKPVKSKTWLKAAQKERKDKPIRFPNDKKLRPQTVIDRLHKIMKGKGIIVTEVGQHQMWAAHYWEYSKPRTFISSGGLGTMGYGFPAAIGAQIGCPKDTVICIAGDGSIQMNMQEMTVAVIHNIPVKVVILNNTYLGMVRQWQEHFYEHNYSAVFLGRERGDGKFDYIPDFVKLAQAFDGTGLRVKRMQDLDKGLKKMLAAKGPVFLEVMVEEEENVWPMIPAGKSFNDIISSEDEIRGLA